MKSLIIILWSLFLILGGMGSAFGYVFTDDFEADTLNPFWSVEPSPLSNAEYSLSKTQSYDGTQSLKLNSTGSGQRWIVFGHRFDQVMLGTVSVMFYDSGFSSLSLYSGLYIGTGPMFTPIPNLFYSHTGVMDWDGTYYYAGAATDNGKTSLYRSPGWHEFKAIYASSGARLYIDGVLVSSIPEYIGFDRLYFVLSGPGQNGVVYFDQFSINANPINAPVAEAGPDQSFRVIGPQVQLDGTQSYGGNGDPITYQWTLLSVPEGSTATLVNSTFVNPTFTPDIMGDYVVELVVKDPWVASAPDTVTISFNNVKPVANAGTNQSVVIGVPAVILDGSASSDADGDPLTYTWGLTAKPAGSAVILTQPTAVNPAFTPDVPGDYTAQLIVNDGFENSEAATVTIHVATTRGWVTERLRHVIADLGNKDLLPDSALKNRNMRNTMITKLNVIIKDVDAGNYAAALSKLQQDVMAKTNGCAESSPPAPDNNDWIVICTYQSIIYPELEEIAGYLTELAK
jgi:hypothetical protein